jgi:hypothetical protein
MYFEKRDVESLYGRLQEIEEIQPDETVFGLEFRDDDDYEDDDFDEDDADDDWDDDDDDWDDFNDDEEPDEY